MWTGIGHEIDRTIADEVAHTAHKTPTACAAALVEQVRATARSLDDTWAEVVRRAGAGADRHSAVLDRRARRVADAARARAHGSAVRLDADARRLRTAATSRLARDEGRLDEHRHRLADLVPRGLQRAARRVDGIDDRLRAYDPRRTLARGWSLTRRADGTLVRAPDDVTPGEQLLTTTAGGTILSTAESRPTETDPDDGGTP